MKLAASIVKVESYDQMQEWIYKLPITLSTRQTIRLMDFSRHFDYVVWHGRFRFSFHYKSEVYHTSIRD